MYKIHLIDTKNYIYYYKHLFNNYKYYTFSEEIFNNVLFEVDNFEQLRETFKRKIKLNQKCIFDCYKYKDWFEKLNVKTLKYIGEIDEEIKSFNWLIDNREYLEIDCEESGYILCLIFL